MLISVALPIYNGMPFLNDAVSSILAQDIELELIVSDDGSSDESVEVVRRISDSRLRHLTNSTNAGIFGNLNRCIAAARGEYVQVFSQDDLMKPGFLASQVRSLQANPGAGLVYGTPDYIDEKGGVIWTHLRDDTPEIVDRKLYLWIASHFGALPPSISSIMIPRRVFDAIGLFNADYRVAGDIEFYNRVAERYPLLCNKEVLHSVRSHPRMTSALSSAGPLYLREERALDPWYRSHWSARDYRKVQRFRSATRGRFHLGWIRRTVLNGRVGAAALAFRELGGVYPLYWVIWWGILGMFRPGWKPRPTISPPQQ
ncbi:MAG TPA: glycosyltransferase [Xanthobacteraceae bacterium]|jgi:glycosyltransferase involved in cell wall biosynthesis